MYFCIEGASTRTAWAEHTLDVCALFPCATDGNAASRSWNDDGAGVAGVALRGFFFFLSTRSALGAGVFEKAVEWEGMFFLGRSRVFYLKIFQKLPLWASFYVRLKPTQSNYKKERFWR